MNYYVVGVNGSGKTTVLKAIATQTNYTIIAASQELIKFMGIENYDQLRAMPQQQVLSQYAAMVDGLLEHPANENLLFDTHLLNLTNGKIIDRTGPWIGRFDGIILIEANAEQVLCRIEADEARDRGLFPEQLNTSQRLALLNQYLLATRKAFTRTANDYSLPSTIITNQQNEVMAAVEKFIKFDNELKGY